ncbi:MAG: hypothetical protein ACTS6H_01505 [Candidatus Hodgkinia cicadicola]
MRSMLGTLNEEKLNKSQSDAEDVTTTEDEETFRFELTLLRWRPFGRPKEEY